MTRKPSLSSPAPRLVMMIAAGLLSASAEDLLIEDFNGGDFGTWQVEGSAFGPGPARGPVDGQMAVGGFDGSGFANSYHGGDDATGTLTSAPFRIGHDYLNFLMGGGKHPGETCMDLLLDGKVLRSATGPNDRPGGSERLDWHTWDVRGLIGKTAVLRIVDRRKGGWGHINVDRILLSDTPEVIDVEKQFTVEKRYLVWPVRPDAPDGRPRVFMHLDDGKLPFTFADIPLSADPAYHVFTDLANHQGRRITLKTRIPRRLAAVWEKTTVSDSWPGAGELYREPQRPQFHFTSRRGWLNDPNGLVFHHGLWHLFYQHNPYFTTSDNLHWGHATSPDLVIWTEQPDALFPDAEGHMWSGSGFVVPKDKAGFSIAGDETLALAYTAEGGRSYQPGVRATQGLAISRDGGKSFPKYAGNPVLPHITGINRDPKILWHEATKHWVMALYMDGPDYALFTSPDLVSWTKTQTYQIPGTTECPDFFPLPLNGDAADIRWVAWGANGRYLTGSFDGKTFTPAGGVRRHYFGAAYAGQSFDHAPAGRRVHIGWMRDGSAFAGAPFSQQMTLPIDFTLRGDDRTGVRLWAEPSVEINTLRDVTREWSNLVYQAGGPDPFDGFNGSLFEIEAVIDANTAANEIGFRLFGEYPATWRPGTAVFSGTEGPQPAVGGKLAIRIFVDRLSMEVFINGTYSARYIRQHPGKAPVRIIADGGAVRFDSLRIHTLRSAWGGPAAGK